MIEKIVKDLKHANVWFYINCLSSLFSVTFTYMGEYLIGAGLLTISALIIMWKPLGRDDKRDESK